MNTITNYVTLRPADILPMLANASKFAACGVVGAGVNFVIQLVARSILEIRGVECTKTKSTILNVSSALVGLSATVFLGSYLGVASFTARKIAEFALTSVALAGIGCCFKPGKAKVTVFALAIITALGAKASTLSAIASGAVSGAIGSGLVLMGTYFNDEEHHRGNKHRAGAGWMIKN